MSTGQPVEAPATWARPRNLLLGAAALLLLVAVAAWYGMRPTPELPGTERPIVEVKPGPPPDPRLTYPTPYRNVRPEVRYVGSAACAECHAEIAASFRHHPMGRSSDPGAELVAEVVGLLPTGQEPLPASPLLASRLARVERYDAPTHDPFTALGLVHQVEPRAGGIVHRETRYNASGRVVASSEAPVVLSIGSGTRGRTYVVARGDALFQSPISWYSQKKRWDLSPGYERNDSHFERPVATECLFCHTNAVEPVKGTANRFVPPLVRGHAIGCERCHGPGELHVASRKRGEAVEGLDLTIVNPSRLEPALRESVCEQCHLQGKAAIPRAGREWFDYRPGLPYHLFWSVFVLPDELSDHHKSVTTVEQMHASKCFQKSGGALGCISCHDPHELPAPEDRAAYYRDRCLQCHAATNGGLDASGPNGGHQARRSAAPACSEAEAVRRRAGDSCIACHMAPLASSDVAHTANTDHRVPRRPDLTRAIPAPPPTRRPGQLPLVHFHRGLVAPDDRGLARDLGIALVQYARRERDPEAARQALPLLEAAVRAWPDDLPALEARAEALGGSGKPDEGVAAYDALVARAPDQERCLLRAAELNVRIGREQKAVAYYERALAINPNRAASHIGLAQALAAHAEWARAARELNAALRLNPFDVDARQLLVYAYCQSGHREQAREEFGRLLGLDPPNQQDLRAWFERQLRTGPERAGSGPAEP